MLFRFPRLSSPVFRPPMNGPGQPYARLSLLHRVVQVPREIRYTQFTVHILCTRAQVLRSARAPGAGPVALPVPKRKPRISRKGKRNKSVKPEKAEAYKDNIVIYGRLCGGVAVSSTACIAQRHDHESDLSSRKRSNSRARTALSHDNLQKHDRHERPRAACSR